MKNILITIIITAQLFSFSSILNAQTTTPGQLKIQALNQMKSERYGEAIELLDRYISAYPQRADGYNLRGLCYEKRSQYEYAVYDYRSARKLEPNNKEINENLSRTTKAWYALLYNDIEGYKREIAINPSKPINYLEIGKCYKNLGNWAEAEIWYDKYLTREKASPDEIIRYSEILAKNNHIAKGWPILKKYTEEHPDDQRLWSRFGYFSFWLGKKQTAIDAFKKALALKPYFKEAMDGLDIAEGKGYIYTVNDTSAAYNYGLPVKNRKSMYAIDRYYRRLKYHPADTTTRYKLIEHLGKVKRYEEAYNQLIILGKTNSGSPRYKELWASIISKRQAYYAEKIESLKNKLEKNPNNKEAVNKLGEYYEILKDYDRAGELYKNYLAANPSDQNIRFKYAQLLVWRKDLCSAKENADILLAKYPKNEKYQLLKGQISVWLNEDLNNAETALQNYLKKEPNDLNALLAISSLYLQKNNIKNAEYYINEAAKIDSSNEEVKTLQYNLDLAKKNEAASKLYAVVEHARKLVNNKNCSGSIEYFKKYLADPNADKSVRNELADAYVCSGDYSNAIDVYKKMLKDSADYETEKKLAKTYYWAGDSIKAFVEFQKLASVDSADAETKLFLGDSYVKMHQYENAEKVYNSLLEESPNSEIIKKRLSWLPAEYQGFHGFPTYFQLIPQASYFNDNLAFKYDLQGMGFQLGLTKFLAIGASGFRGHLSSDLLSKNITMFKGNVFINLNKNVSASAGIGRTMFPNSEKANITEASLKVNKDEKYDFTFNFNSMDAAQILYSPYLVDVRLQANYYSVEGSLKSASSLLLSGKYSYITVSDDNAGNNAVFRIGKLFDENFSAGYEYYYYNFQTFSDKYWSPSNFDSHSIWGEFMINDFKDFEIKLGGKIGIIPADNFVLREFFGKVRYTMFDNFIVQGQLTSSSTVKQKTGYNSLSVYGSAYWTF